MRNIILCGFMGSGKTTVGKRLAQLAGMAFADMDADITEQAGMTVEEIFELYGEAAFRRMERESCVRLAARQNLVVAAGGGALLFPENREALAATGTIVWLDLPPETVIERLAGDTTRPLLRGNDPEQKIRELYALRRPLYEAAAQIRVNGDQSPDAVAREIMGTIK